MNKHNKAYAKIINQNLLPLIIVKLFFTKILSFFLAASILLTTSSFTVDQHYCCNKLVDMSILGKAKVCKDNIQKNIPATKKCEFQKKDCCDSRSFVKQGENTLLLAKMEFEDETIVFINSFLYTYINLFEGLQENIKLFEEYRPPLLSKDIPVLYETFLI